VKTFVIGYDIRQPRRLSRVRRVMVRYAAPIEYSIFVLCGNLEAANRCLGEVLKLINPQEDDLRCYQLPVRGRQFRLGRASLPEGIFWTGLPESCL